MKRTGAQNELKSVMKELKPRKTDSKTEEKVQRGLNNFLSLVMGLNNRKIEGFHKEIHIEESDWKVKRSFKMNESPIENWGEELRVTTKESQR